MAKKNKGNGGIAVHRPKTYSEFQQLNQRLNANRYVAIDVLKSCEVRNISLAMADAGRLDTLLAAVKPAPTPEEPFDVLREINSYKEVSFKTAPKSVILSNFLNSDDFGKPSESPNDDQTIVELGKKSISPENMSESETLAVILEKQGRYPNAIEVYKKLILKYPEKSSTFAARITNLESLINNNQ